MVALARLGMASALWCRTLGMGSERQERMKVLRARLRALRDEAGLSGCSAGPEAGVGWPTVSKVENGRLGPCSDVLGRLARALLLDEATSREVRDPSVWPLMTSCGRLDWWTRCV
ncbi:helix-turn-helix transcriptional regulator [Streptomyces sp. OUCMDZ-4982]|uniref:helix-turn-helix domain-containing protein n=1 Tax=Streptomyces sp. OUCMDZ-4982 TaxID=2973090 RepID=UPI0028526671|nr:helix-turn-helix transcriptional regulator [Streptomyces sp. OUCMDZ-4982]